ncbi:MAG: methyltransferase domain-containing protein [Candidatus Latescibacteria bacterium]|nr:methyltransferase domain-containing protein [bacterium]MBD3423275.1 methyltransferase domain-containing protein [Candidatus Latescibacterota bacterium]
MNSENQEEKTMISRRQWDQLYTGVNPHTAPEKDQLRKWLEEHAPRSSGSCLEIGCFPGRYLSVMGRLGYRLYGVDLAEKLPELEEWLSRENFNTGTFWQEDFFSFDPGMAFDMVLSLGFIEHFQNWDEVLEKHFPLVKKGGHIILEAPNFTHGVQSWIHRTLDRENYLQHFPEAMDIESWRKVLERGGFEVIFCGYAGRFDFWVQAQERGILSRSALTILRYLKPAAALLPAGNKLYSPYAVVMARKRA